MFEKILEGFNNLLNKEKNSQVEYGNVKCVDCKYHIDNSYVYAPGYGHYCGFERKVTNDPVFGKSDKIKAIRCNKKNKYNNCLDFESKS